MPARGQRLEEPAQQRRVAVTHDELIVNPKNAIFIEIPSTDYADSVLENLRNLWIEHGETSMRSSWSIGVPSK